MAPGPRAQQRCSRSHLRIGCGDVDRSHASGAPGRCAAWTCARVDGRFAEARALFNSWLEQELFNPDLYENGARVCLVSGCKADAIRCLQRGRMSDPSHTGILGLFRELGLRRRPLLRFLPRGHPGNVWLGQVRQALGAPRYGKSS